MTTEAKQLIDLVQSYRDDRCRQLQEQAQQESRQMVRQARRRAHQEVRDTIEHERARAREQVRSAEAELHTRKRASSQRLAAVFLRHGQQLLLESLSQAWNDHAQRGQWIRHCAQNALDSLPGGTWQVRYPAATQRVDLQPLQTAIEQATAEIEIAWTADATLQAGLIISIDSTCLDMSLQGLVSDRKNIEGRLLALLHEAQSA